ncbi:MAG: tRNA (adenosine(37)-N6)-threonylcarbamoyltransferase complex transferase subunit TsaD [Candidatus Magasanikiibacteriota bacterium]
MRILSIESSCDDTSVALVKADQSGFEILAELTASQIEIHKKYGGVVPEIAGRMHAEKILPLVEEVLGEQKPDVICVTSGPGLITGLLVGVEAAKTLSYLWDIPLIGVNHIEGHIHSPFIPNETRQSRVEEESFEEKNLQNTKDKCKALTIVSERSLVVPPRDEPTYPALALIASGGHTELILIKKQGSYKKIGATLDDAAGECFDKVAKLLNFEYPGGPKISKFAETGNTKAIEFPRPMLDKKNFDFSFAGLKTSALYWLRDNKLNKKITLNDFCASFEQAIIDVLVGKTLKAVLKYKPKTVILGGGVAANKKLRETLQNEISPYSLLLVPSIKYAMDNAAMIAVAGYYKAKDKKFTKWNKIKADPNWEISF